MLNDKLSIKAMSNRVPLLAALVEGFYNADDEFTFLQNFIKTSKTEHPDILYASRLYRNRLMHHIQQNHTSLFEFMEMLFEGEDSSVVDAHVEHLIIVNRTTKINDLIAEVPTKYAFMVEAGEEPDGLSKYQVRVKSSEEPCGYTYSYVFMPVLSPTEAKKKIEKAYPDIGLLPLNK